jgi:hypothetical protein
MEKLRKLRKQAELELEKVNRKKLAEPELEKIV